MSGFTVGKAIQFAARAHAEQFDKLGIPYIEHCLTVMQMFEADLDRKVALLHDTIEDTDLTLDDLRSAGCEKEVIDAIDALTKRPGEPLEESMRRVRGNSIAAKVKLGDIAHNVSRLPKIEDQATRMRLTAKYGKSLSLLGTQDGPEAPQSETASTQSLEFTRPALEKAGFSGFIRFADLSSTRPPDLEGIYVVYREGDALPTFGQTSVGGWFKGKDPTVEIRKLEEKWVPGAPVVYIGKAGSLRKRLDQFRRFGGGQAIGHWGGRYLWQCEDVGEYLVAWLPTQVPAREVEMQMISRFEAIYGRKPFANLSG